MGHSVVLNFFHNFKLIRPCVQNYFFTPEIDVDKWLKNNEIWCVFMAFFKALIPPLPSNIFKKSTATYCIYQKSPYLCTRNRNNDIQNDMMVP